MRIILLVLRTIRHLRPVQIVNRILRRLPHRRVRMDELPATPALRPAANFPEYYRCLNGDAFTFLNETITRPGWNDADVKKLWLYNLHYFDCLRQAGGAPGASDLVARWIAENPVGVGNGWEPYPISLRVVNWIKWTLGGAVPPDGFNRSLAVQTRFLAQRLEWHLLANHLLANAKALVFAGVYFAGAEAERWYRRGMAIYRSELPRQVLADGVHFELSAMYHSIILEDLLDCCNLLKGTGRADDTRFFADYAARMVGALERMTGSDGTIVKFNDAADGIALAPVKLMDYARALSIAGRPFPDAPSGIVRLEKGDWVLIAKCGAIGPDYQPGHAHADTGTFELWHRGVKVIADTGTDRYVVDAERCRQRGTTAHNCVTIDDHNSSEVWGGHRVARRVHPQFTVSDDAVIELRYRDVCGNAITRRLRLAETGLEGEDAVSGHGSEIALRWHQPAEVVQAVAISAFAQLDGVDLPLELHREDCQLAVEFGRSVVGRVTSVKCRMENGKVNLLKWKITNP